MKRLRFNNINTSKNFDKYFRDKITEQKKFGLWRPRMRIMMKEIRDGMKIVELGCGQTLLLAEIKKKYPNCEVHGLDFSSFVIKEAKRAFPNIRYKVGDFFKTPYQDNYFNCVLGGEIIEHVDNPDDLIKEMVRICKPGGFIVLSTSSEVPSGGDPFHLWLYNVDSLKKLLLKYGKTEIIKCEGAPGYGMSLVSHCQIPVTGKIMKSHIVVSRLFYKDEKALRDRLLIYKETALKSLLKQEDQNFDIAILCKLEHKDIVKIHPKIIPFFSDKEMFRLSGNNFSFFKWEDVYGIDKYDIQTNLDSDDSVSPEFTKKIQETMADKNYITHIHFQPLLRNYHTGEIKKMKLRYNESFQSMFYSIYQPNKENYIYIGQDSHSVFGKYAEESILIPEGYCWMNIHDKNSSSTMNI